VTISHGIAGVAKPGGKPALACRKSQSVHIPPYLALPALPGPFAVNKKPRSPGPGLFICRANQGCAGGGGGGGCGIANATPPRSPQLPGSVEPTTYSPFRHRSVAPGGAAAGASGAAIVLSGSCPPRRAGGRVGAVSGTASEGWAAVGRNERASAPCGSAGGRGEAGVIGSTGVAGMTAAAPPSSARNAGAGGCSCAGGASRGTSVAMGAGGTGRVTSCACRSPGASASAASAAPAAAAERSGLPDGTIECDFMGSP
jgi:hypothetical protein